MGKYVKLSIDYESLLLCSVQISKYHPPTAISQAWCWVWDFFYFFIFFFGLHLCCALYPPGMGQFFFLPPTWLKQGGLFLRDLWVKVCRQVLTM